MFFKTISTSHQFYIFPNILLFFIQADYCMVPRASQEGSVRSFKSYSDVTMFHYTIPKEVLRVTWQFAAFMDDPSCQPQKVYIHLRYGSYPIISNDNGTFPMDAYSKDDHSIVVTTIATYQPKNITIVPIYGPQAGDWFVGAYMSRWNERIQQQGLGHKCHYSIGTVVLWSQVDSIKNIPVGYQTTLRTSATATYYKIYIPSGTWSFRLTISNCSFTLHALHNIHEQCIENMSLKGRALPTSNYFLPEKSASLAIGASYTFIESSPYEDSYYYLSIVSSSIIEFNIKIDIIECPIRMTEKSFSREYINNVQNSNAIMGSTKDTARYERYYEESNGSGFYSKDRYYKDKLHRINEEYDIENSCIPRHQLVRVKHADAFSAVYLLQGNEWLSSRLMLKNSVPVMMQFDILPLVDIGGTLDINMHLETEKLSPKALILITICVRRGRIPKLEKQHFCQNDTISMNLFSLSKHNASLLIAYPQPGIWYILMHVTCSDQSVHYCQNEEISVLLNVRTKQCVFSDPNPCGDYGVCRDIQKNGLHYTTCNCFEGYTGWNCTSISNVTITIPPLISNLMLIGSNFLFLPVILLAVKRELYVEGLVYLATMLISSFYHACDQNSERFCIAKYEVLQYSDFFSSILAFWVTLLAMAKLPNNIVPLCNMIGVFVITIAVQINKMCLVTILVPLSISSVILIFSHIYCKLQTRKWEKPNRKTLIGLLLALIGSLLYSFLETENNYQFVHSVWHIIMAMSLMFLLPKKRIILSRRVSSNDDRESQSCKESYGIPTFTLDQDNRITSSN